jgi:hypothetical protein
VSSTDTPAVRNRDEIASAIRSLTPAQWARLRKVSLRYGRDHIAPDDLLQEALRRAIDNDGHGRNCPCDIDVVKFLAEAMRSIAHGEYEKMRNVPKLVPITTVVRELIQRTSLSIRRTRH